MPTVALQLTEELADALIAMAGPDADMILEGSTYAVVEFHSAKEFHVTFMNEDEIFQAVANNDDMQIMSL
jgi:hypothetical protein